MNLPSNLEPGWYTHQDPANLKLPAWACSCDKDSFFKKYLKDFVLHGEGKLSPPTLVFQSKRYNLVY